LSDASVIVSWPLETTGVALETSTTLEPGSWSLVDEEFLTSEQSIFPRLPEPLESERLYRMRRR
jgi:hypothetical protein